MAGLDKKSTHSTYRWTGGSWMVTNFGASIHLSAHRSALVHSCKGSPGSPKISTSFNLQFIHEYVHWSLCHISLLQENPAPRIEGFRLPIFCLLLQRRDEEPLAPLPRCPDLIPRRIHQQHLRTRRRFRFRRLPGCVAAAQPFFDGQGGGGSGSIVGDDITWGLRGLRGPTPHLEFF